MSDEMVLLNEIRHDVTLVHIMNERLLDPLKADALSRHLCGLFDSGVQCVLVDLDSVQRLSSVFFRSFIMAGKTASTTKAKLAFCNLSSMIHEGFAITGLTDLFPIFKNESEALAELARK